MDSNPVVVTYTKLSLLETHSKKSVFVINIKKSNWQPRDEIIWLGIKNRLIKTVLLLIAENRLLSIKKLI